jgi:predicted  nucleic acid-binding Zn-ribbon protein
MIGVLESLLTAQNTRLGHRTLTPEQEKEVARLCADAPAGLLQRFERLVSRGKKAVATVRSGVCSECHLRLPSGTLAALAYTTEIHYCDNCGRMLYLPQDEPLAPVPTAKPVARKSRPRAAAATL